MDETILIVDDNPANLKLIRVLLSAEGYAIQCAADAEEALTLLAELLPDLILMDLQLPGMDGLALTRKLKADPETHHIPILALTAYAMKGDEQKAREAGCDGYITKPIDTRRLPQEIAQFLASHREPSSRDGLDLQRQASSGEGTSGEK